MRCLMPVRCVILSIGKNTRCFKESWAGVLRVCPVMKAAEVKPKEEFLLWQ
jgi:hypothetical protein